MLFFALMLSDINVYFSTIFFIVFVDGNVELTLGRVIDLSSAPFTIACMVTSLPKINLSKKADSANKVKTGL